MLRLGRLAEAYIAPPGLRQLRELVRYRAKLVALRSGLKAQVHAVLAKEGVAVPVADCFGLAGRVFLDQVELAGPYRARVLVALAEVVSRPGESPEVVLEACYGWYWAADVLADRREGAFGAPVGQQLGEPAGEERRARRRRSNDNQASKEDPRGTRVCGALTCTAVAA